MKIHRIMTSDNIKLYNKNILNKHDGNIIGCKLRSITSGFFEVIKYDGDGKYTLRFIDTGELYHSSFTLMIYGEIKDYMFPSILSIGYLGKDYARIRSDDKELFIAIRNRYQNVMSRCYNIRNKDYERYGAIGVKVSDRWLNFSNFYNDIIKMDNFNREKFISGELVLDKDIKQINIPKEKRVYDRSTVTLTTAAENDKIRDLKNLSLKSKFFVVIYPDGTEILKKNIAKFSKEANISDGTIHDILASRYPTSKCILSFRYPTQDELKRIENNEIQENSVL